MVSQPSSRQALRGPWDKHGSLGYQVPDASPPPGNRIHASLKLPWADISNDITGNSWNSRNGKQNVLDKYEHSLSRRQRAGSYRARRAVPDMDSWAEAMGVDIKPSKEGERDRRRLVAGSENQSFGAQSTDGKILRVKGYQVNDSYDEPEIVALAEFLQALQDRLGSLERHGQHRSVRSPHPASSDSPGNKTGGETIEKSQSSADIFGVPRNIMVEALEVGCDTQQRLGPPVSYG